MAKSCRNACMWAGQRVLCLLRNLFKRSKLSLTLTLARAKCWCSCSDSKRFRRCRTFQLACKAMCGTQGSQLETVQVIEHSVAVNGCKNSSTATIDHKLQDCLIGGV